MRISMIDIVSDNKHMLNSIEKSRIIFNFQALISVLINISSLDFLE